MSKISKLPDCDVSPTDPCCPETNELLAEIKAELVVIDGDINSCCTTTNANLAEIEQELDDANVTLLDIKGNQTNKTQFTKITDGTDTALVTAAGELNVLATAQPGVDIGDVTVNNGAGAAAVNIQDGGNSITVDGAVTISDTSTGTWANGTETAVAGTAVQVQAVNASRRRLVVQNTGLANVRIGITGVTATTGVRLVPGGSIVLEPPYIETNAIFAIREGAISSTVLAQETT